MLLARADRRRPPSVRSAAAGVAVGGLARCATPSGRPLFAFKLHQFIGKGDTVYTTLEPAKTRYLTTQYQRSAPHGEKGRPLFPLAFCRECGQDFLVVNLDKGGEKFSPASSTAPAVNRLRPTGLLFLTDGRLARSLPTRALLDLVPEDWIVDGWQQPRLWTRHGWTRLPAGPTGWTSSARSSKTVFRWRSSSASISARPARQATRARSSRSSPEVQPGHRGPRQRGHRLVSVGRPHPAGRRPTSTPKPESFWRSLTTGRTPACRLAISTTSCLVGLVRSALYRAATSQQERNPDEPLTDEDLGTPCCQGLGRRSDRTSPASRRARMSPCPPRRSAGRCAMW